LTALKGIADQGEGYDLTTPGESHFERFFAIYKLVSDLVGQDVEVAWSIATNPNTSPRPEPAPGAADALGMAAEAVAAAGRITEPRAKAWAQLFNLRYRMPLGRLAHFLRLDQEELYVSVDGPQQGDRTARGLLLLGAFDEMRHLKKIAAKLVRMPKDAGGTLHAGPPFELPYSLSLPDGEAACWRIHLDVSRAAVALIESDDLNGDPDPFLTVLKDATRRRRKRWRRSRQARRSRQQPADGVRQGRDHPGRGGARIPGRQGTHELLVGEDAG